MKRGRGSFHLRVGNYDMDINGVTCNPPFKQWFRRLWKKHIAVPTLMEMYMMIKPDEFRTLVDYYKGKISESTLLDKAARVVAEAQILIDDPNTPAALKEPVVKEMLKEKNMLNDKLRQGPSVAMTAPGVPQPPVDDDEMDGLQERLLKELVKSINANTQSIVPQIRRRRRRSQSLRKNVNKPKSND